MSWFNKLFKKCEHNYEFVRNIYGDEINFHGGCRSEWRCKKCGKIEYRKYLQKNSVCQKLDDAYDAYYKNKYENWCDKHAATLNNLLETMMKAAKEGYCWSEFILICKEEDNDKNYYEKWFNENKLKVEIALDGKEKCTEVNQYKFNVRWKFNKL